MKYAFLFCLSLLPFSAQAGGTFFTIDLGDHSSFECSGNDGSGNAVKLEYLEGWVNATVNGQHMYGSSGWGLQSGWFRNPTAVQAIYKNSLVDGSTLTFARQDGGSLSVDVELKGDASFGPNKSFSGTLANASCQRKE